MLENLDEGTRPVLLSPGLEVFGKAVQSSITFLNRLEHDNFVGVAPFLDLKDVVLVLAVEKITSLLLGVHIHNEKTDNILSRRLGCGRRDGVWAVG